MKKILIAFLCVVILCAMPLVAFAEDDVSTAIETNAVETETFLAETEIATEGEISGTETEAETEAAAPQISIPTTDEIVKWVEGHLEEISVIVTLIFTLIYQIRKHAALNKSIAHCNNNAVAVVENSNSAIQQALSRVEGVSAVVDNYREEIVKLLTEIRQTDEEKKKLETALTEVENYLHTSKLANKELADEVAELLVLANIPNSKKEELYSRHRAAVAAIDAAEHKEVKENVGDEA